MIPPDTPILVVDDMMTMRKVVTKICKDLGFTNVTDAADGAIAWGILQDLNKNIQLVISDWNMPNMSGLDLLKKVRNHEKLKDIPFVMVTAEAEAHQIKEAITSGVSSYIVKPFTADGLKKKLETIQVKKN